MDMFIGIIIGLAISLVTDLIAVYIIRRNAVLRDRVIGALIPDTSTRFEF